MGLQAGDLKDMVYNIFEIDGYKSKMGSDENIITLSFSAKDKKVAEDLTNFIEKGYNFVLDADNTSGEQSDGTYKVFVEIEREKGAVERILELADGIKKLTDIDDFKFRYYKNWKSKDLSEDSLNELVPVNPEDYGMTVTESNLENYKNFFSNSYVEEISLQENILTISKKYADPVYFEFIDFGDREDILLNLNESINVNEFAEIIFLTKYVGDYNITKFGNKLVFENKDKLLVVQRIT